jgi:multidrug resistance efflux pump
LERVVQAMVRQGELLETLEEEEHRAALREAVRQLIAIYGDKVALQLGKYL